MDNPLTQRLALIALLVAFLVIGVGYAVLTPAWQIPDEPAHYNYVRQIAAGRLPVIEMGDYDQEAISQAVSGRFPPSTDLDAIQYEDHQPPLYYVLAAPIFEIFGGALLPLRLFSVLLGLGVLLVAARIAAWAFPGRPFPQFIALGVIAFVPQHVAMLAGVNNDSLAELLMALALLAAVAIVQDRKLPSPWVIGLLLGAAFWTKSQVYVAAPVLGLAILLRWRREKTNWGWRWLLGVFGPALLMGLLWWERNLAVYGGLDWMGLARHNQVVLGQPTTAGWIAEKGLTATLSRLVQFTFQSFWGMFGWMEVQLPARIYRALVAVSIALLLGFLRAAISTQSRTQKHAGRWDVPIVLTTSALATTAGFIWYNLSFVQHQGRYFFPALIPLALAAGVALESLVYQRLSWRELLAAGALAVLVALAGFRMIGLLLLLAVPFFALLHQLPLHRRLWVAAGWGLALAALCAYSLLFVLAPTLS